MEGVSVEILTLIGGLCCIGFINLLLLLLLVYGDRE
jgi:hypothetical protein